MEFEMELNLENDEFNVELGITETLKGKDGADGKDGIDGKDGLSAYEIATKNGFEGSEEEWLASLKGADGIGADIVPIEKGGTGAVTAEEAKINLGVAASDLSNVDNTVFAEKATAAGVGGGSSSSGGGVGKDLTGQKVSISKDATTGKETIVTAGTNAEIFNDYRDRTYYSGGQYGNVASGDYSHAEGSETTASGNYSHAEGGGTIASGNFSHAEGVNTTASGGNSHAEGNGATASKVCTHAEGYLTTASGDASHAEGYKTTASGYHSHAEGNETTASQVASHAEGYKTTASGNYSHAEGYLTTASGYESHAEGYKTTASGNYSHAEGEGSKTSGSYSHAGGYYTIASSYQLVHGRYNKESIGPTSATGTTGDLFIIGNGTSSVRGNAFRISTAGEVYGQGSYSSSGADYSEYFEWLDGNPENEDRVGYFVTLDGEKIRKAASEDKYILGVVSVTPSVEGDSQSEAWQGMYLTDIYGRKLTEIVEVEETTDEDGIVTPAHTEKRWILNPDYDSTKTYENRENRKEWTPVGLIGKLVVRDDGTCQVNSCCKPNKDGIATASDVGFRVMKRLGENHIKILLK